MHYPDYFNDHIQDELKNDNPFDFPGLQVIDRRRESEALHELRGPKVIIAGSGMMTGGRIVGHAAHYLTMNSTRLLIVGYQGEETLGRELLEGNRKVVIDGVEVIIHATVVSNQSMSSHADQGQLLSWLKAIKGTKKVILTHGEDPQRHALSEKISSELGIQDVDLPVLNQEIKV
jgi:metallo-beta-lactamase family protein